MKMYWKFCALFTLDLFSFCASFNVDPSAGTRRDISPYPKDNEARLRNPIFFGYAFNVNTRGRTSLSAGAPKRISSQSRLPQGGRANPKRGTEGDVYNCPVSFQSSSDPCEATADPSGITKGDSNGLTIGVISTPSRDQLISCAPTKRQVCKDGNSISHNYPGFCYRSNNNGRTWRKDPRTRQENCPALGLDLIFLLDGSFSVGVRNFATVRNWVTRVASRFSINNGTTRLGVVQYSHYNESIRDLRRQPHLVTEISLGEYRTQQTFRRAVNRIKLHGFTTYTAHAINYTVGDFMRSPRFSDPETSKVLILVTDGNSSDVSRLPASARYARNQNIRTFAVGVGMAVVRQLRTIATGDVRSDERVYYVNNFNALNAITDQLQTEIFTFALEGSVSQTTTNYEYQYSQYGLSMQPTRKSRGIGVSHNTKSHKL